MAHFDLSLAGYIPNDAKHRQHLFQRGFWDVARVFSTLLLETSINELPGYILVSRCVGRRRYPSGWRWMDGRTMEWEIFTPLDPLPGHRLITTAFLPKTTACGSAVPYRFSWVPITTPSYCLFLSSPFLSEGASAPLG